MYIHMHALTNDVLNIQYVVVLYSNVSLMSIVFQLTGLEPVLCSICQYVMIIDYCLPLSCAILLYICSIISNKISTMFTYMLNAGLRKDCVLYT